MRRIAAAIAILLGLMAPAFGQVASPPIQIFGAPGSGSGSGCTFANPTATASDTAVNGVATTCMRSDAAPPVQKGGSAQFGVVEVDGSTITAAGGVISAVSGGGNALFGTTTGNTANDFVSMSNTTVGVKDSTYSAASFAPAGQVVLVTGSDPTITAAEWAAYVQFTITGTGRTLTFPASSTLSNNGGAQIDTNAGSVTVTANAADTITYAGATSGAGGSVTLPVSGSYIMSTDGAGKFYISGNTILGSGLNVRAATAQGNGTKAQYSTGSTTTNDCVKFDANGNTIDSGGACGTGGGSADPEYLTNLWYSLDPFSGVATGSAVTSGTTYFRAFSPTKNVTFKAVALRDVAASVGGLCVVSWWAEDPTTLRPTGTNIGTTTTPIDTSSASSNPTASFASPVSLTAGVPYWYGVQCNNGTNTFTVVGTNSNTTSAVRRGVGSPNSLFTQTAQVNAEYRVTGTYGTLPSGTWTTTDAGTSGAAFTPILLFEVN